MECRVVGKAARWGGIILAGVLGAREAAAQYASGVFSYVPGTVAGSPPSFNDPLMALGEPSRFTNDPDFPGPVDPFNAPYLPSQLVTIGLNGSLTLQMSTPVRNDASHPYGLDFIIYGNAGFIDTDFPNGVSDGSIYGPNPNSPAVTRVSVSADGTQFYNLDMTLAPGVDAYYPTDGSGIFGRAVDPSLTAGSFSGKNLAQIRALYAGSAGGTGFDLAWARDAQGGAVSLTEINYIRVEVLNDKVEIDGIAAVPEPSTWALLGLGTAALLARKLRS